MPQAVSLTEEILTLGLDIQALELVPSSGGAFEIIVEGEHIYSKLQTGEFPKNEDILKEVKSKL